MVASTGATMTSRFADAELMKTGEEWRGGRSRNVKIAKHE
jgi:hypothetical protein